MTCRAPLARGALLLQDSVDVVHFAQPLEEGDEVQQLCVGHVIEPRGHGHLDDKPNIVSSHFYELQQLSYSCFYFLSPSPG